jgi:hypothetical protein
VVLGWGLFALDETRAASNLSAVESSGRDATRAPDPSPDQEHARELAHGTVREAIDDANDILLAPFASLSDNSDSKWTRRTVPAFIALLVYGLGLSFLARFASVRS